MSAWKACPSKIYFGRTGPLVRDGYVPQSLQGRIMKRLFSRACCNTRTANGEAQICLRRTWGVP